MKYLTERSLYYYSLMSEVMDTDKDAWNFIAENFGVESKTVKTYEKVLANHMLNELSTLDDIEMYKNYVNGFFSSSTEFGKTRNEQEVLEAKTLALHKARALFGDMQIKGNRLSMLPLKYERDHTAAVLYALQILYLNHDEECSKFVEEILIKELKEGENSDAGLILLKRKKDETKELVSCVKSLPDMLLRPDMIEYLTQQYGGDEISIINKRTIGF